MSLLCYIFIIIYFSDGYNSLISLLGGGICAVLPNILCHCPVEDIFTVKFSESIFVVILVIYALYVMI